MEKDTTPCNKNHMVCASGLCVQPDREDCKGCTQLVQFSCQYCHMNPCDLIKEV